MAQAVFKVSGGAGSLQGAGATVMAFGTKLRPDVPMCPSPRDEQGLQVMTWGQDGAAPAFLGRGPEEEGVRCDSVSGNSCERIFQVSLHLICRGFGSVP